MVGYRRLSRNEFTVCFHEYIPTWEACSCSTRLEILHQKGYYHLHNSLSMDLILRQWNSIHIFRPHIFKIHFNITLPSTAMSPKWLFSLELSDYKFICICVCPMRVRCPAHLIHSCNHTNNICGRLQIKQTV